MSNYRDTIERFNGLSDDYDKYRPTPPEVIKEILINYLDRGPEKVVHSKVMMGAEDLIGFAFSQEAL